jgi:hypothetical protein
VSRAGGREQRAGATLPPPPHTHTHIAGARLLPGLRAVAAGLHGRHKDDFGEVGACRRRVSSFKWEVMR